MRLHAAPCPMGCRLQSACLSISFHVKLATGHTALKAMYQIAAPRLHAFSVCSKRSGRLPGRWPGQCCHWWAHSPESSLQRPKSQRPACLSSQRTPRSPAHSPAGGQDTAGPTTHSAYCASKQLAAS